MHIYTYGQHIHYSRRSAAGSARTKVTRCHMFFFFLLLLLLLFQVKYFRSKTSKNIVFSAICYAFRRKNFVFYNVFAESRAKIVQKHR